MKHLILNIILVFLVIISSVVCGQPAGKKQYLPMRIDSPPSIDGILDEKVWEQATWVGDFVQHEPHNGREPSQRTEFSILYDDDYLYVGIRAYDTSPDSIVTRLTRRDNDDGDAVGIAFDSYHDLRTAFMLGVTAGGTRFDFIMTNNGKNEDPTWDPNWWVRTKVNDQGWVAEMRIPFSQLRFKKNGNGGWGLQVFRKIHRKGELSMWQHTPADAPGFVHLFGELHGMDDIHPRRILDFTPYVVSSVEGYQAQKGNPFATGSGQDFKAGLDAKIGITNSFTLDLTINPDFGQVEADPSEVNLSAFESFFQEKRPFFIEGRSISSFSLGIGDGGIGNDNLFYSRRIGRRPAGFIQVNGDAYVDYPSFTNIIGAAKVTGKTQDGLSVAIIQSVTGEARAQIDLNGERSFQALEPLSNYFVGRVQKDINDGNTIIGGMVTSVHRNLDENLSNQMHSQAYTGGIDFSQYFRERTWMFNVNAAFSHVAGSENAIWRTQSSSARYFQRPDAGHVQRDASLTSLSGTGGRVQLVKSGSGHWSMMAATAWKSPGFEINDIGFMREADQIIPVLWVGYRQWEPKGIYRSYNINFNVYSLYNFDGLRSVLGSNFNGFMRLKNYWGVNAGFEHNHNPVSTTLLRGGPAFSQPNRINSWWGVSSDNRKKFIFNINGNLGAGLEDNREFVRFGSSVTYKPADNINFSFSPSWSRLFEELQYVGQMPYDQDRRYIFASIDQYVVNFSFRINYTITPDLTIQYWGQPFIASGGFRDFKYVTDPRHQDYPSRFENYAPGQISLVDGAYMIDENMDGNPDYQFGNPDFNFREFLSNLVLRWEYNPGSTLFLVWNQTRSGYENLGSMQYVDDIGDLFATKAHNIFLLKFSYRLGVK